MENSRLILGMVFGILALGVLSNQMVFADPGADESPNLTVLSSIVTGSGLDLVEHDSSPGTTFFGNGGHSPDSTRPLAEYCSTRKTEPLRYLTPPN